MGMYFKVRYIEKDGSRISETFGCHVQTERWKTNTQTLLYMLQFYTMYCHIQFIEKPNLTVTCINQSLGCPVGMLRKDINLHLAKCPASVVVCMAEWNRWPVFTAQKRETYSVQTTKSLWTSRAIGLRFDFVRP